jgi:hypothetical protein
MSWRKWGIPKMDDQPIGNRRHDGPEQYLKLYETRYGNFASPVYAFLVRKR